MKPLLRGVPDAAIRVNLTQDQAEVVQTRLMATMDTYIAEWEVNRAKCKVLIPNRHFHIANAMLEDVRL